MEKEIKISMSFYKLAYAVSFVVILSLIRGVTFTYEIGIAMEAPIALLTAAFCTDTYAQEITSKRAEVHRLYPMKKRVYSVMERLIVQMVFLFLLAFIGYGLFFLFQKPFTHPGTNEMRGCLLLWITVNSTMGDKYLKEWNLFSYTFRYVEDSGDFSWVCGKILCIGIGAIMLAVLPELLKKRG